MKILITDDETLARTRLRELVESLGHSVAGEAHNGEQALRLCEELCPDVILLDIRMPVMDGIETARHLLTQKNPPAVIFTTAFDQHALQAFDMNAIDYLLKPVRKQRLLQSLAKASHLSHQQIEDISGEFETRTHICARGHNRISLIPVDDIIYFMADQKYISVITHDAEILIEDSLKSLEQEFMQRFIRIHRSTLVAIDHIASLEKSKEGGHFLLLKNTEKLLDVSRRHVAMVRKTIRNMG